MCGGSPTAPPPLHFLVGVKGKSPLHSKETAKNRDFQTPRYPTFQNCSLPFTKTAIS
jgi:hypothetical protein